MHKPIKLVEDSEGLKRLQVPDNVRFRLSTFGYCYLQENGYFNDDPSDKDGYTPWYTYPAITFLKDILQKEHKVFEYGSGYSTLFFKDKVQELYTVEHDNEWAKKLVETRPDLEIHVVPQGADIHELGVDRIKFFSENFPTYRSNNIEHDTMHGLNNVDFVGYASEIYEKPKRYFDIIIVDGMARALTAFLAAEMIKDDGIIILDNSDRWHYNTTQEYLIGQGFGRIDFWGPGHENYYAWCTSFFSKSFKIKNNNVTRPIKDGPIFT